MSNLFLPLILDYYLNHDTFTLKFGIEFRSLQQPEDVLDKKLLDILACPLCKSRLIYDPKQQELICRIDKIAYPIREDIPIMLVDEARRLSEQEVL